MDLDREIALDLRRYRRLKAMLACADFRYFEERDGGDEVALIFALPAKSRISGDLDATLDALIEQSSQYSSQEKP